MFFCRVMCGYVWSWWTWVFTTFTNWCTRIYTSLYRNGSLGKWLKLWVSSYDRHSLVSVSIVMYVSLSNCTNADCEGSALSQSQPKRPPQRYILYMYTRMWYAQQKQVYSITQAYDALRFLCTVSLHCDPIVHICLVSSCTASILQTSSNIIH